MRLRPLLTACLLLLPAGLGAAAAPKAADGPPEQPLLRVEGGGPTAQTTALAFSPDGHTLYAAGYDKVVRAWKWDENAGFVLQDRAFRVPIGPGTSGAINGLAVSPDGAWLAVTGLGVVRGEAGFREEGVVLPVAGTWDAEQWGDRGLIYLFNLRDAAAGKAPEVRLLRGHRGVVLAMTFAPAGRGGGPVLVSAAREPQDDGSVRGRALVWDVDRPRPLAELVVPGAASVKPPGLAVRRTGPGEGEVRVALAWRDGLLRAWDVAAPPDRQPRPVRDGEAPWNGTAAFLPGPRLLTGGFTSGEGGYLRFWDDRAGEAPAPADRQVFATPEFGHLLPRALCPVQAGEGVDHIAAVFQAQEKRTGREFYRLYLLAPDTLQPQSRTFLWDVAGGDPFLACSPDGRFVAVAGPGSRSIRVYQTADLLRGRAQPQELASVGTVFRRLAFAQKGKAPELGLFLDDLLFDFANRRLTHDAGEREGWSAVGPAGWSVSDDRPAKGPGDHDLRWAHGGQGGRVTIHLEELEEVTAAAVAPPLAGVTANPTVAVATWKGLAGEPQLALYEAGTGLMVRQLKGHAGRITSLAVSPDGRFLASAAQDETVCLWGLTDLNQVIGKHGTLSGAVLKPQGPDLLVERVEKGTAAGDSLKPGDLITGLALRANDPKPRTGLSPLEFYLALWDVPPAPGDAGAVWLRVRRDGQERQVRLQVEQGVDDRKQVLSLFVAGAKGAAPRWIAWTPLGPFDSSGQDAERYVGWHLNPDRPGQPARFADVGQYRKQFYRPRLLPLLLASGDLPDVLKKLQAEIPRPVLHLVAVAGASRPDREDQFLVRDRRVPLRFTVEGPSLAEGEVAFVVVTVDGRPGPRVDLGAAAGQELSASVDLPGRGVHTVHVEARTAGDAPRTGAADVQVRYQPLPPAVTLPDLPRDRTEVQEADYPFRAKVVPAAGQAAKVRLVVNDKEVPVESGANVEKVLKLARGQNRVRLTAFNEGALPGYEAWETTAVERIIDYREPQAADVVFTEVEPRSGAGQGKTVRVGAGAVPPVATSRLRLLGTVTAPGGERLALVRLLRKVGKKEEALQEFAEFAGEGQAFRLDRVVSLEEGPQEFLLTAKTAHKKESQAALRVTFEPPLPDLRVVLPQEAAEVVQGKDRAPGQADVAVTWPLPAEFHGFEVAVRVSHDGKPVPQGADGAGEVVVRFPTPAEAVPFDEKKATDRAAAKTLATVRLAPGENRVEVQARNPWQRGKVEARTVTFRRPPFLLRLDAASPMTQPFTTITAVAESPSDLPLTAVRVNEQSYDLAKIITEKKDDPQRGTTAYTIRVEKVALAKLGDNPVRLEVGSDDGSAEETRTVVVKEAPPRADIRTLNVPDAVSRLPFDLRFRVKSRSPLRRVELKLGGESLLNLSVREPDADGNFTTEQTVSLRRLRAGTNSLVLEAVNDGGLASHPFTISYTPPPLRLEVDELQPPEKGARIAIHGRLVWGDGERPGGVEKKAERIAVYVNDFLQRPPSVTVGEGQAEFTVTAVLNQPENKVRIECPGLPLEAGSIPDLPPVRCAAPEKPSTLRVLIVNATEPAIPDDDLVRHALSALNLHREGSGLDSKVFRQVISYPRSPDGVGAVTGFVTQELVLRELRRMEDDIRANGDPSDVVLIYWLGKDAVEDHGDWYLTTFDDPDNQKGELSKTAVRLTRLLGAEERVQGGRVVMMDVAAGGQGQGDRFDWRSSRTAVIRYAWSQKAVPFPGLLTALEKAAQAKPEVSLGDLAQTAAELLHLHYASSLRLTENLSGLSGLVLTGK